jgi:lysophospholipase L1-like esterase
MTIRILQAWNGYPQQAVVSMSASEETRLVGLGIASFDLDGPAENVRMAQLATDAGGQSSLGSAPRTNIIPSRIVGWSKSAGSGFTMHGCFPTPYPFTHIQLVYEGLTSAAGITAKVAASAVRGNGYAPKDTGGADVTATAVTFGTTDPNSLLNPGGGASTGTCPAGTGTEATKDIVNGRLYSDIIALPSYARTDGGTNYLAMVRTYTANAMPAASQPTINPATGDASGPISEYEPDWAGGYQSGFDGITNWATYAPTGFDWISPASVRFFSERSIMTIASYGDSTQTGWAPSGGPVRGGGVQGYVRTAVRNLFAHGFAITHYNRAKEGNKTTQFLGNAIREIPVLRPSVAILRAWSINDGISQAIVDNAMSLLVQAVAACRQVGTVPIVEVPPPQNLSGANEALRVAYCARVRNMGLTMLDLDALTTDGGSPASIRQSLQTAALDGVHFNRAGHDLIASRLQAMLQGVYLSV